MMILLLVSVLSLTTNITEFDDGGSQFNMTSDIIKYITIPINSTILNASLNITGLNSSESTYKSNSLCSVSHHIKQTDGTPEWVYQRFNISGERYITKFGIRYSYWSPIYTYKVEFLDSSDSVVQAWTNQNQQDGTYTYTLDNPYNIENSSEILKVKITCTDSGTDICLMLCGGGNSTFFERSVDESGVNSFDTNLQVYSITKLENPFIQIGTPDSVFEWNQTGLFNESNLIVQLNKSLIQTYVQTTSQVPFHFNASTWGKWEINELFIQYNKSYFADIDIVDPSQITQSVTSGNSYTETSINITNTGNYNATNISFVTVSGIATANYNDSLSWNCSSATIVNQSSVLCDVTFSSLTQDPEADEKLKARVIGSDNDDIIFSEGIDIDITVTSAPASTPTGGGGSSGLSYLNEDDAEFDIVGVNAFNQDTGQLSIRPLTEREYCLDLINYANVQQRVYVECDNEDSSSNICRWFTFDRQDITLQPSEEIRETFCMTIKVPEVVVGDKYVVFIRGQALSPSSLQGSQDIHKITMTVTDPTLIFGKLGEILFSTSISDNFYALIKKYFKSEINEVSVPNITNPFFIILHFILVPILVATLIHKKKRTLKSYLIAEIGILIVSIFAMSQPVVMLWEYILITSGIGFGKIFKKTLFKKS